MGSESQGQSQVEGRDTKTKHSEKQIFTTLLLVTFTYLTLTIPGKLLIFYLNFFSGNTPYYYAGLHLFYQIGEDIIFQSCCKLLSLCNVWSKVQDRFEEFVHAQKRNQQNLCHT